MPEPDFEVRPSVMVGDTADVSSHRAMTILRNERVNPIVTMEFTAEKGGVFCGIREAKALLSKVLPEGNREVWALEEGAGFSAGEVTMRITAPYGSFGLYETALCGTLSHSTGWATASKECVVAAAGIPVISVGARYIHPSVAGVMDYAATIGGCVSCSTPLGAKLAGTTAMGTISPNISLIMGDVVPAMQAFDTHIPQEISRVSVVNVIKDETEETMKLVTSLRQRLRGVMLDGSQSTSRITPTSVKELRARLDLAGYSHVEIFIRGNLNGEYIKEFVEYAAPVNAFEVGHYISGAVPYVFSANIHEVDGKPVAKRGLIPGSTPNLRLVDIM